MGEKRRKKPELNDKQKKFVEYYVQCGNITEAAKKAGYSPKTACQAGYELAKNEKIKKAIEELSKQLESERIANAQEIQEHWTAVMRGETKEEVAVNVGIGKGYTQVEKVWVQASAKERLKAAELLAKCKGMFVTKQEIDIQGSLPVVIRDDL